MLATVFSLYVCCCRALDGVASEEGEPEQMQLADSATQTPGATYVPRTGG